MILDHFTNIGRAQIEADKILFKYFKTVETGFGYGL